MAATINLFGKPEILAAKIADIPDLDDECILERARVVSIAPARMPFVGLKGRYNKRWYVDIVTLPHNAIRKQLADVFTSLIAMNKMALDLTEEDFQLFFRYLQVVADFFKAVLDGEEVALYPSLPGADKKKKKEGVRVLHENYRKQLKKKLFDMLEGVMKYQFTNDASMDTLAGIQKELDVFAKGALDYFVEKEKVFPEMLQKHIRGGKEKTKYEARLIQFLLQKPKGHQNVCLLIQTLFSKDVRTEFFNRHFPEEEQRTSLMAALEKTESGVCSLTAVFENAATKYEKRFSMGAFMSSYGQDREEAQTKLVGS